MKRIMEKDYGDGCTVFGMYLIPLNHTLGIVNNGKWYMYFTTIKKIKRKEW
jgi:hypothetical protein